MKGVNRGGPQAGLHPNRLTAEEKANLWRLEQARQLLRQWVIGTPRRWLLTLAPLAGHSLPHELVKDVHSCGGNHSDILRFDRFDRVVEHAAARIMMG